MSLDISSPSLCGLSDSESELEELELLPPDEFLPCCLGPLGGLLPLELVVLDRWIEPVPECSLRGCHGKSYSDSTSSLSGNGILPSHALF
jgi:hypothetical protein